MTVSEIDYNSLRDLHSAITYQSCIVKSKFWIRFRNREQKLTDLHVLKRFRKTFLGKKNAVCPSVNPIFITKLEI